MAPTEGRVAKPERRCRGGDAAAVPPSRQTNLATSYKTDANDNLFKYDVIEL